MDHSEVRELLEDAAIEPGGLERLMAGDTPAASIVAGHLAGCPDCGEELERLRRSVSLIRPAVRAVPSPELRARTLAYVAAVGRDRGGVATVLAGPSTVVEAAPAPRPAADDRQVLEGDRAGAWRRRLPTLTAIAAALIVAVAGTVLVLERGYSETVGSQAAEIEDLGDVARWTVRVDGQPDVRRIRLASASGGAANGTLIYSPSSTELVMVADGLQPIAAGQEYSCWMEIDGRRSRIGRMALAGDLAYWVGDVDALSSLPASARLRVTFGVSLTDRSTPDVLGIPVLVGGT